MAFTETCCRSGGSNLNSGTKSGNSTEPGTSATYTAVGDSDGTSVFTPSDGSTPASSIAVGDFGSVYVTAGATVATFIGRITTVAAGVNGAVTFSTTAKVGTFPAASAGAHTITLKVGGAWKGPNGATAFPFGFVAGTLTNAAGHALRVNFKNDQTYSITASMVHSNGGPDLFYGYTTTYGDGGKATIDGGTSGASYVLLNLSSNVLHTLVDLIFKNNGATGLANGVSAIRETIFKRCVFANVRGNGITVTNSPAVLVECEAYGCNQSNTASTGGFQTTAPTTFVRCVAHDNTGSNNNGFVLSSNGAQLIYCIADSNGLHGVLAGGQLMELIGCEAYNNGTDGLNLASTGEAYVENCNFVKNGGYGIGALASNTRPIEIINCGFGSGTQANSSGQVDTTNLISANVSGSITYASNTAPWVDPANGDFRVNLSTAKGAGRGTFTQTQASYTGTVGYPDIGAAQHLEISGTRGFAI